MMLSKMSGELERKFLMGTCFFFHDAVGDRGKTFGKKRMSSGDELVHQHAQ